MAGKVSSFFEFIVKSAATFSSLNRVARSRFFCLLCSLQKCLRTDECPDDYGKGLVKKVTLKNIS